MHAYAYNMITCKNSKAAYSTYIATATPANHCHGVCPYSIAAIIPYHIRDLHNTDSTAIYMLYVCWEVVVAWESKQRLQSKAMGWPGTTSKAVGKCVCVCAPVKIRILYLLPMRDFHNTVPTAKGYIAIFTSARKLPLLLSLAVNSHPHHMLF